MMHLYHKTGSDHQLVVCPLIEKTSPPSIKQLLALFVLLGIAVYAFWTVAS